MADTNDKSLPALASELWELVVAYLKQETLEPIKSLGRFVLYGVIGAVTLSLGLVLVALAGLRALQTGTADHLTGTLSWLPYFIVLVAAIVLTVLFGRAVTAKKRKAERKGTVA